MSLRFDGIVSDWLSLELSCVNEKKPTDRTKVWWQQFS